MAVSSPLATPLAGAVGRRLVRAGDGPWVPALYAALAVVVAGPLLRPGLVLAVDLAQTPRSPLSEAYWGLPSGTNEGSLGRLPIDAIFAAFGAVGAMPVAQKLLLLAIVFLAGFGMHRVVAARTTAAALFAGTLFAVNPFVHDRLVTGQWLLLLAYALLPWAYGAFLAALRGRDAAAWAFAALIAVMGGAGAHMAVLALALCVLTLVARVVARAPGAARGGLALGLALAGSLLWLIPAPGLRELFDHVGAAQLDLYATRADPAWGLLPTVASLQGYWNGTGHVLGEWALLAIVLMALAAGGTIVRRRDPATCAIALAGVAGLLFAFGTASATTRPIFTWLLDAFPPARAFREPQKAVALVVFAYAFLGAAAVDAVLTAPDRRREMATAAAGAAIVLPLLFGVRLVQDTWSTLRPTEFPASWRAADDVLRREASGSRTLFLPFHGYLNLDFAHSRVTYNPAPAFFSTPILSSRSVTTDPEFDDAVDPEGATVALALDSGPDAPVGDCLASLGVSHIALAHQADWRDLAWLERHRDLTVVGRWQDLTLLRLRHPGALAMTAPAGTHGDCPEGLRPLAAERAGPAYLRLAAPVPVGRRLVLGVPAASAWSVHGARAEFSRWPAYRRIYIAGAAGWSVVLGTGAVVLRRRRNRGTP